MTLWNIDPFLIAYREVPQESTRFSPFELLYERPVRGALQVLEKLWTEKTTGEETRTSYEYVIELREKLQEATDIVKETLGKSQTRYKHCYKRTKSKDINVGDQVQILLPASTNKLLMAWRGPFKVIEKVFENNITVMINGKERTYHVNLLKKYLTRGEIVKEKQQKHESETSKTVNANANVIIDNEEEDMEIIKCVDVQGKEDWTNVNINANLNKGKKVELEFGRYYKML